MSRRANFRFMVDAGDKRSAVWTVSFNRSDVYISSSMSKQDKVSLHESGAYQWSLRYEALSSAPYIPETGRHLARWENPKVQAGDFTQNFLILIAESELRAEHKVPEKAVTLLPAPPVGCAVQVGFYFFDNPGGAAIVNVVPAPLFSHQLKDGRLLVLMQNTIAVDSQLMETLKDVGHSAWAEAQRRGLDEVSSVARITSGHGVSGMMEIVPRPPQIGLASPEKKPPNWTPNAAKRSL